ncbi:MAG TPA: MoxR family ATPase, partial [Candidatus Krumholzibacteria bacterium]|nr:MoxR family ATPase [Candidatus Krumholzibacteria bacterium]
VDPAVEKATQEFCAKFKRVRAEIGKAIVGHDEIVEGVLTCLFVGGNALLEGVPGLGKTYLVRSLAEAVNLKFSRIQFTPDLMPADIIGTNVIVEDPETGRRHFEFQKGPLFAQIILADEINRATPKTQSAMLEAMQEHSITAGGTHYKLEEPFFVLATQNPIEQEGTYPLPEAQLDRFLLKLRIGYPSRDEEREILDRMAGRDLPEVSRVIDPATLRAVRAAVGGVFVDEKIKGYILDIVFASRDPEAAGLDLAPLISWGASPRATLALTQLARARALLRGRAFVIPEDVKAVGHDALRHRILVTYEAEAENLTSDDIVTTLLDNIEVP